MLAPAPAPPEGRVPRCRRRRPTDACWRRPLRRPTDVCSVAARAAEPARRERARAAGTGRPHAARGTSRARRRPVPGVAGAGARARPRKLRGTVRRAPAASRLPGVAGPAAGALARELRRPPGSRAAARPSRALSLPGAGALVAPPALELVVDAVVDVDVAAVDVAAVEVDVADVAPVDVVPDLVVGPAHRPRRGRAEEHPRTPGHAGAPGVVVPGVRRRVVADHRQRRGRHHDHRIVPGHVHDLRVGALDRDDLVLRRHRLLRVGPEIPGGLHLAAEALDGVHHLAGIGRDLLAEADRPLEVRGQHVDHVRRVQQVAHALVPVRIGLEGLVLGEAVEEAIRLHHVEGVGRGREHDREEGIGVEGDRGDEVVDGRFGRDRERRRARRRARARRTPSDGPSLSHASAAATERTSAQPFAVVPGLTAPPSSRRG